MSDLPLLSSMQLAVAASRLRQHSAEADVLAREPIAIVGLAARLPNGTADANEDLDGFWQLLAAGRPATGNLPAERHEEFGDLAGLQGAFLRAVHDFDAPLFRLSRREATSLDPQQRLLLEVAWEALESAAIAPDRLRDAAENTRVGVYVGLGSGDYGQLPLASGNFDAVDNLFGTGNAAAFAAGRLSYHLGLSGPAMTVETACSSSLTALHLACRALRGGECEMAIVGGTHLILAPFARRYFQRIGALAPDGRSKTFAANADGFGNGEGCVATVLMPLSQAVRHGYHIHALIRGTALSQDGASGGGLTVPSKSAQEQVIRTALQNAGLQPDDIDYVETHGTGTDLGDPIEVSALQSVFGTASRQAPLHIGAVKANIGHTEAAAGLCGLAKIVLSLQAQTLPPQPPIAALNPHVDWARSVASVVRASTAWPRQQRPRRAGLSAFGLSGTNAHVIIEEAPEVAVPRAEIDRPRHLYALSARSGEQLADLARRAAADLAREPQVALADICFAANAGRARHQVRAALHVDSHASLREALQQLAATPPAASKPRAQGVVFLLTGQGNPSPGAGAVLYRTQPVFRAAIDRCAALLEPSLDLPLQRLLFDAENSVLLQQTRYAQPATVALSWSLAQLWADWGIHPVAMLGHSLGEYSAAAISGMANIDEILPLVAARGTLMQEHAPAGRMLAVAAPASSVIDLVEAEPTQLALAVDNGERNCVLAGSATTIERVVQQLAARKIRSRALDTNAAFHSPLMDSVLEPLQALAAQVSWRAPAVPVISNLSAQAHEHAPDAAYWARHARGSVRFREGLATLLAQGHRTFLELGPRPVLSTLGESSAAPADTLWCSSLNGSEDDWQGVLDSTAALYTAGIDVDWVAFDRPYRRSRTPQSPSSFARSTYKLVQPRSAPMTTSVSGRNAVEPTVAADESARIATIQAELRTQVAQALGEPEQAVTGDRPFVEMGADSVVLAEAVRAIQTRYSVKIGIRELLGELNTINRLGAFLATQSVPAPAPTLIAQVAVAPVPTAVFTAPAVPAAPLLVAAPTAPVALAHSTGIESLFQQQLTLVQSVIGAQLAALGTTGSAAAAPAVASVSNTITVPPPQQSHPHLAQVAPVAAAVAPAPAPQLATPIAATAQPAAATATSHSDPRQAAHFDAFAKRYIARTAESKRLAGLRRQHFADVRASAGFRPSMKELLYPITGERSKGALLWDVDGNEYIDISMDFGVNLFGHGAPFMQQAAHRQIDNGIALGPRSPLAAECAKMICELSGMDRVLFCQSGSESVMTAVRLARLLRGRDRIATFRKSYHGHFDGFLGDRSAYGDQTEPAAPGIAQSFVNDLLVLDYGSDESLEAIARQADTLAAVLVEPVQSRNVGMQPREFLQRLRELTKRHGILLIFDEMITGFRTAPGGAQQIFGVEADLATYGKTIGGGVPMAALAARGNLLDGIDGGQWQFGDTSAPNPYITFFAGTFNNHPLGLALCHSVLTELKRRGPSFQESLTERTHELTERLNRRLSAIDAPLSLTHFGSLFRFKHAGNLDLLYYHLLYRGLFVWEGRNCFLCDAHGEAEIDAIVERTMDGVEALREGGYLPGAKPATAVPVPTQPLNSPLNLPLSDQQKQIWIASQIDPAGALAYVETVSMELEGRLDAAALQRALGRLAERHEALRTTLDGENDRQTVHASLPVPLRLETSDERDAWLTAFQAEPLDLSRTGPLQVGLLQPASGPSVLAIRAHHALIDGISLGLVVEELSTLLQNPHAELPAALPFREHLRAIADADDTQALAFWQQRIAEAPAPLPLSTLGSMQQSRWQGARVRLPVPAEVSTALGKLAGSHGTTIFTAALATTLSLLHASYDRDDVLIGIGAHGRKHGHERMVGQAAQVLPWRSRLKTGMRFDTLLREVDAQWQGLGEYQAYPVSRLLEQVLGNEQRAGALNVIFNMDHTRHTEFAGLPARLLDAPVAGAKFELSINLLQTRQGWLLDLDYSSDRYEREQIERIGRRWLDWAGRVATDPHLELERAVALPAEELNKVLAAFATDVAPPPAADFVQLFREQLARAPQAIAIRDQQREYDYATLDRAARVLAKRLHAHGAGAGRIVAAALPRSAELVTAVLACFYAGAAILPISGDEPKARRTQIFATAQPAVVLTLAATATDLIDLEIPVIALESPSALAAAVAQEDFEPLQSTAGQLAFVIYTSGSTGVPKGVECTRDGLARLLAWNIDQYEVGHGDTVLLSSPTTFDVAMLEICLPLASGGRVAIVAPEQHSDPQYLARLMVAEQVTFAFLVPALLELIVRQPEMKECRSLRHLLAGGDTVPADLRDAVLALGLPLKFHNAYGPTETTILVSQFDCLPGQTEHYVPIGYAPKGTWFRIVDSRNRPVGVGIEGDLLIGGEQLSRGYLGDPELTRQQFATDPLGRPDARIYRSGDRACWREDGAVIHRGRADRLVKLRGQRLELGEIEIALRAHPQIGTAVVDLLADQTLIAWYVPSDVLANAPIAALRDYLASRLPAYMVPTHYLHLPELPLMSSGKVDRAALPRPAEAVPAAVSDASPLERELLDYIHRELQLAPGGTTENFFAAGGQSLSAAKLVSWVRQHWQIELPLKQFLAEPSVRSLAIAIEAERARAAGGAPASAGIIPIRSRAQRRVRRDAALEGVQAIESSNSEVSQ
ncbi:hybrid non-ribosomal peptide synthetase/type I polyketide synthase [Paraburkholderia megapolitana]|uniref:Amino acid adenylation domain-containing protein n=1 Tax=Paraburkholderia megapolitana TaxID=420953 RepID=A0A1I3PWN7_9BURK|nr:hybrid non-ribosomal peptide synthetase/type I polyketide synthase [Paraburkholderia megapolitana]QDQ81024.1 hybrid non-ribosomal peptide synthetase/type I polyketide synthase [Paraburkholderia megapolitana]SFJ25879.1 amino acid adenylation domain-containing protein [Paraburkholderia megapolitana]